MRLEGRTSRLGLARLAPRLELRLHVQFERAREQRELQLVQRLPRGVTPCEAVQILVSVATEEGEPVPLAPLALPVGGAQPADTSSAFPTIASTSLGVTSW
jgi:hypothetical protein